MARRSLLFSALLALVSLSASFTNAQELPVVSTLANTTGYSIFGSLLQSFPQLAAALDDPARNSTIFAPNDVALGPLAPSLLLLNATRAGRLFMFKIVEYHVHVGSIINVTDLEPGTVLVVPTLAGYVPGNASASLNLTLDKVSLPSGGSVAYINNDTVLTQPDVPASNGIIQGISNILNPLKAYGTFPRPTPSISTIFPSSTRTTASAPTVPATLNTTFTFSRPTSTSSSAPSFAVGGGGSRLVKRVVYLEQRVDRGEDKKPEAKKAGILAQMLGRRAQI